jgi:hypothetical protein
MAGGRSSAQADISRDFPDETLPTNVVGNFARDTEVWRGKQDFAWLAAASIAEIWAALFAVLTLPNVC